MFRCLHRIRDWLVQLSKRASSLFERASPPDWLLREGFFLVQLPQIFKVISLPPPGSGFAGSTGLGFRYLHRITCRLRLLDESMFRCLHRIRGWLVQLSKRASSLFERASPPDWLLREGFFLVQLPQIFK
ncbi:hypothetical protein U1Q18_003717, partial [Sarracenia purpurea var. burkii]